MKKLIVIAAALLAAVGARAADGTADANSVVNPVYDVTSGNGAKAGIVASFLWAPAGTTTYTPFTTQSGGAIAPFPFLNAAPGFYDAGANGTLFALNQGALSASVIMRAWTQSAGTFATASTTQGAHVGQSAPITVTLGGGGSPPALPVDMGAMASFTLSIVNVPEPSTIALGLLGAGALLLRRRK